MLIIIKHMTSENWLLVYSVYTSSQILYSNIFKYNNFQYNRN